MNDKSQTTAILITDPRRSPKYWVKFQSVWDGGFSTKAEAQRRIAILAKLEAVQNV